MAFRKHIIGPFLAATMLGGTNAAVSQQSEENWQSLIQQLKGASPEEIIKTRKLLDALLEAREKRPNGEVSGRAQTVHLKFRGGQASQTIDLVTDRLTAVGIYDQLMNPIGIETIQHSAEGRFFIAPRGEGSNTFTIQPLKDYATGNLVIYLIGENEPLVLDLKTGKQNYFSKINLQLNVLSAASKAIVPIDRETPLDLNKTEEYFQFMDGRIPAGANGVAITSASIVDAWSYGGELIVLSRGEIYSPISNAEFLTPDDLKLYVLDRVGQLAVVNAKGKLEVVEVDYE